MVSTTILQLTFFKIYLYIFVIEFSHTGFSFQLTEMSNLNNDMTRVDVKPKVTDKSTVEKEIEKKSQQAIGNLSEDELQVNMFLSNRLSSNYYWQYVYISVWHHNLSVKISLHNQQFCREQSFKPVGIKLTLNTPSLVLLTTQVSTYARYNFVTSVGYLPSCTIPANHDFFPPSIFFHSSFSSFPQKKKQKPNICVELWLREYHFTFLYHSYVFLINKAVGGS